jgi:hypothetical protein
MALSPPAKGTPPVGTYAYPAGTPVISADGTIYIDNFYIGSSPTGNRLLAFPAGSHVSKVVLTIPKPFGATPAIGRDGTIYVGSFDHSLYAVH